MRTSASRLEQSALSENSLFPVEVILQRFSASLNLLNSEGRLAKPLGNSRCHRCSQNIFLFFDRWNSPLNRTPRSIYLLSFFFRFESVGNVPVTEITTNLFYLCYKFMSLVPGLFTKNDNKHTAGFYNPENVFAFLSDFFFFPSLRTTTVCFTPRGKKQMTTFELSATKTCKKKGADASPTKSHLVRPQVVVKIWRLLALLCLLYGRASSKWVKRKIYFIRSLFARILYRVERFWGRLMARSCLAFCCFGPLSQNLRFRSKFQIRFPIPFPRFTANNCTYDCFLPISDREGPRGEWLISVEGPKKFQTKIFSSFLATRHFYILISFTLTEVYFFEIIFLSFQLARKCR